MTVDTDNQRLWEKERARRDRSRKAGETAYRAIAKMRPKDRLDLARSVLHGLLDEGITYADFQSAQACERYVRKAARALDGLG